MQRFQYKPIDLSKHAIRVVRLCKGSYTERIRCELFEAYLDQIEGVPYEAVSYTWGNQSNEAPILLDGKEFVITSNLFEALSCLRLTDQDRILWIDALCIDQENDLEKGHQVSRMKTIYEYAEQVIIWLGLSNSYIDELMDSAQELGRRDLSGIGETSWLWMWQMMMKRGRGYDTNFVSRRLAGLQELSRRAWFRRVWIIQEVAVAKRATIRCGWKSVSTRIFAFLPQLMEQAMDAHVQAVLDVMPGPSKRNEHSWWSRDRSLMSLLAKFRYSESKDPRDSVYALLGISSDFCDDTVVSPDYQLPLVEMVQNVVWALLFNEALDRSKYTLPAWNKTQFLDSLDNIYGAVLDWAISELELPVLVRLETCTHKVGFRDRMPLHSLIKAHATPDVVRAFLNLANPDVNLLDEEGQTPLNLAVAGKHVSVFKLLMAHEHIKVNQETSDGHTPLNLAAAERHIHMFEMLVQRHDIDINHVDCKGDTPLNTAVGRGDEIGVETLLRHDDIDVNRIGSNGQTPLFSALGQQQPTVVSMLLRHEKIKTPEIGSAELQLLHEAISSRDKVVLSAYMAMCWNEGMSSRVRQHSISVAIVQALAAGHLGAIRMLLNKFAPVDRGPVAERAIHVASWKPWGAPRTPLSAAVMNRHEEAIELLLQRGAQTYVSAFAGATPLMNAVKMNQFRVVELLLESGADIDESGANGQTPLCSAVIFNNYEMIRLLLRRGANVNRACSYGDSSTPWSPADKERKLSVIQLFLDHGIHVETINTEGMTPLGFAIRACHWSSVLALLGAGASVDQVGQYSIVSLLRLLIRPCLYCRFVMQAPPTWICRDARWNPHTIAIVSMCASKLQTERHGFQTILSAVVKRGVEPLSNWLEFDDCEKEQVEPYTHFSTNSDTSGKQSQDVKCTLKITLEGASNECIQIFPYLLRYTANTEARDMGGETLLWMAVCRRSTGLVQVLLMHDADVETPDEKYGMSPLWVAALLGFDDIIRMLLAKGASIERACLNGHTPLSVAAEKGCRKAVKVLLEHGANRNVRDAQGRTPLEAALENGHEDIVDILQAYWVVMLGADEKFHF